MPVAIAAIGPQRPPVIEESHVVCRSIDGEFDTLTRAADSHFSTITGELIVDVFFVSHCVWTKQGVRDSDTGGTHNLHRRNILASFVPRLHQRQNPIYGKQPEGYRKAIYRMSGPEAAERFSVFAGSHILLPNVCINATF